MDVTLIDYTGCGAADPARHAANVLVFTKQTRLEMSPEQFAKVEAMSQGEIIEELRYMSLTLPSSWEFVDYKFLIRGVTRAFTHQLVRTRTGSYAQQAMRVVNVAGRWTYSTGPTIKADPERERLYDGAMEQIDACYNDLIASGASVEDARGLLPTNIHTNICAKFNLRALVDLHRKRMSGRVQDEYREVLVKMVNEVMFVHPWSALFFMRTADQAAQELRRDLDLVVSDPEKRRNMHKLLDQVITS